MLHTKQVNLYNNFYSSFLITEIKKTVNKNTDITIAYIIFLKRIYFVKLTGSIIRYAKKNYIINQTITLFVRLRKNQFLVTIPIQSKAIVIFK